MNGVALRIPATSANLGAGFDSLGLALTLYHEMQLSESDRTHIFIKDKEVSSETGNNLILRAAEQVYQAAGKPLPKGFTLVQNSHIPSARGLGSSAACIAGGLLCANRLLGDLLPTEELLLLGCRLEGHPDNLLPAFFGGFCVGAVRDNRVLYRRCELKRRLHFVAMIPDHRMRTEQSRAILPEQLSRADCAFQLSGAALTTAAFFTGNYALLADCTADRLCTPIRLPQIPEGERLIRLAKDAGAITTVISGAGSTLLALFDGGNGSNKLLRLAKESGISGLHLLPLRGDNRGAVYLDRPGKRTT